MKERRIQLEQFFLKKMLLTKLFLKSKRIRTELKNIILIIKYLIAVQFLRRSPQSERAISANFRLRV